MVYDLAIIGGGAAGLHAAQLSSGAGLSTLLLEKKTAGNATGAYWTLQGLKKAGQQTDRRLLYSRARAAAAEMESRAYGDLERGGVTLARSYAWISGFSGPVFNVETASGFYNARRLLITTGSVPRLPANLSDGLLTPSEALALAEPPCSVAIYGVGLRAVRLAVLFAQSGTAVTLIDGHSSVFNCLDAGIAALIASKLREMGVSFIYPCKPVALGKGRLLLTEPGGGREIAAEKLIVADSIWPATRGIGIKTIGAVSMRSAIVTDLSGRTSVPDVYAAGDASTHCGNMFVARRMAEVCVANMLGRRETLKHYAVPYIIEAGMEAGSVGLKTQAVESGQRPGVSGECTAEFPDGEQAYCRIVAERRGGRLLGAHMYGDGSAAVLRELALAIGAGLSIDGALRFITPCGYASELARAALLSLGG